MEQRRVEDEGRGAGRSKARRDGGATAADVRAAEAQRVNKAKKKKARGGEGASGTGASGKRKFFFILRMKVM